MAIKEKEYIRLPGRGMRQQAFANATRSRLWLGKDHLLCIDTEWYNQTYKRFYFRDIQAFIIRKTGTGSAINIVLAVFAFLCLLAALATTGGFSIFWSITTGLFGVSLLLNSSYGPTCRTHVRTAVQTEELPSLKRLRRAKKVIARIRPLIIAAQGEIAAAEIPARMEQLARSGAAEISSIVRPASTAANTTGTEPLRQTSPGPEIIN